MKNRKEMMKRNFFFGYRKFIMRRNEEVPELFRGAILYREWGYRLTTIKKLMEAVRSFEKSIELSEENNLRTLLGLARALMMFTRYRAAAENADKCLEIGKFMKINFIKKKDL